MSQNGHCSTYPIMPSSWRNQAWSWWNALWHYQYRPFWQQHHSKQRTIHTPNNIPHSMWYAERCRPSSLSHTIDTIMVTTHTHSNIVLLYISLHNQQLSASPNVGICIPKKKKFKKIRRWRLTETVSILMTIWSVSRKKKGSTLNLSDV